jgi:uncharacterized protein (DUF1697 family)
MSMPRYVAFLRGLNLGKRRVKMDRLCELFEAEGLDEVASFIASGNVVFRAGSEEPSELERRIESRLREGLGYEVSTILRTLDELRAVAALEPFAGRAGEELEGSLHVLFLRERPGAGVRKAVEGLATERDAFRVDGREIYWATAGGMSDSAVGFPALEKALAGATTTARNVNTVRRLVAKHAPGPRP